MRDDPPQEVDVGLQTADRELVEHAQQPQPRLLAIFAPGDQLAEHRVVERRNFIALLNTAIDPTPWSRSRFTIQIQATGGGQEIIRRVFGIQAHFNRMAIERHLILGDRQRFAARHTNLPRHQIESGDRFGDRVLDLQTRVHLHEEEFAARIQQELHGPRADVTNRLRRTHRRFAHGAAQLRGQARSRGFFDDFLVPALNRTITLVEVQAVAMLIGEHLNFHMAWFEQVFLHQHPRIAE